MNLDTSHLPQGQAHIVCRIHPPERLGNLLPRILDGHPAKVDRADLRHVDPSVRTYFLPEGNLAGTPHVDDHFIARPKDIGLRRGGILIRLERQVPGGEEVMAVDRDRLL